MTASFQELSSQFNSLLTEYTNTYQDYISAINSNDTSFNIIPNSAFIGESTINTLNGSSINGCQTSCSSTDNCSGATFNNDTNVCSLSSGSGNVVSTNQSTSIVQQVVAYSYKLQQINSQLTTINKQMMNLSKSSYNKYTTNASKNNEQEQAISQNYQILQKERDEINEMISQYQTLNTAYEDGNLNVTSNYYRYIALLFFTVLLSMFLLKSSVFSGQSGGGHNKLNISHIVIIIITLIVIGCNLYLNY